MMAREETTATAPVPTGSRRTLPAFTDQLIEPFSRLRSEVDRLFDDFPFRMPSLRSAVAMAAPALEMRETKKAYKLTAELPGIDPEAVEVSVDNGMLRIAGEKNEEREEDEQGYRISERSYGAFERIVSLPDGADAEKIKARCRNGVLTITIPKDEKAVAKSRKIAIERA
jgi:HSP20 family protein